jgi:hypothetical protein
MNRLINIKIRWIMQFPKQTLMSSYRLITGKARYYKSQIPKSLTLAKETLQKEQIVTNTTCFSGFWKAGMQIHKFKA